MKAFALIKMTEAGYPQIPTDQEYSGRVLCDRIADTGWGAFLISGTPAQLSAINGLPTVIGLMAVSEGGSVRWPELDGIVEETVRTKLNSWLANHGQPLIPADWTNRQLILAVYRRANANFKIEGIDISDVEEP